jgi:hypothetical protein
MDKPIVLFTNLFTLENKSVENNKYIDIFFIWLNNIVKYANLTENDYVITFMDEITLKFIANNVSFRTLINKIKNYRYIVYKQPKIIKEGMMKRFEIEEILKETKHIEKLNPQYLYLDVDVLIVNNIRKLFIKTISLTSINKTTIHLMADNRFDILNGMFYGELASDEDIEIIQSKKVKIPGFSSGIFGWCNSVEILEFFNSIRNKASQIDKELYTVDQPFFNAAIFNYFFQELGKFQFDILNQNEKKIKMNMFLNKDELLDESKEVVLVDYCGSPGDDTFHWQKLFSQFIIQNL